MLQQRAVFFVLMIVLFPNYRIYVLESFAVQCQLDFCVVQTSLLQCIVVILHCWDEWSYDALELLLGLCVGHRLSILRLTIERLYLFAQTALYKGLVRR